MRPAAVPFTVGASGTVYTGRCNFRGASVRETAGAVAAVRVYDGTSAAGTLVAAFSLPANGSAFVAPDDGVQAAVGLYWSVVSGAVEGSVWVG